MRAKKAVRWLGKLGLCLQCVLQCIAVCCSVLQCAAVCCGVLARKGGALLAVRVAVCVLQSVLQCVAVCCSVLQCVAVCCCVLQCVAVRWLKSGSD